MTITLKYLSDKSYNSISSESVSGSILGAREQKLIRNCHWLQGIFSNNEKEIIKWLQCNKNYHGKGL